MENPVRELRGITRGVVNSRFAEKTGGADFCRPGTQLIDGGTRLPFVEITSS